METERTGNLAVKPFLKKKTDKINLFTKQKQTDRKQWLPEGKCEGEG